MAAAPAAKPVSADPGALARFDANKDGTISADERAKAAAAARAAARSTK